MLITHADGSRVSIAVMQLCNSVCVSISEQPRCNSHTGCCSMVVPLPSHLSISLWAGSGLRLDQGCTTCLRPRAEWRQLEARAGRGVLGGAVSPLPSC